MSLQMSLPKNPSLSFSLPLFGLGGKGVGVMLKVPCAGEPLLKFFWGEIYFLFVSAPAREESVSLHPYFWAKYLNLKW